MNGYSVETLTTPGYEDFVETSNGQGIELRLRWLDRDADEMQTLLVHCEAQELEDLLTEKLGPLVNRDPELDLEFSDDIERFCTDIRNAIICGDAFCEGFEMCEVRAFGLDHPLLLAIKHDGCTQSDAYRFRDQENTETVCFSIASRDGKKSAFKSLPEEADILLGVALRDFKKKSGISADANAIRNFLASARQPKAGKDFGAYIVTVENSAIKPRPARHDDFSDDLWLFEKANRTVSEYDPADFDDEAIRMLKKSEESDDRQQKREELYAAVLQALDEYENSKNADLVQTL